MKYLISKILLLIGYYIFKKHIPEQRSLLEFSVYSSL